jgi:hypothetical protein
MKDKGTILSVLVLCSLIFFAANGASQQTGNIIEPEEILKKIEEGSPVNYDNVIIDGDLNLTGLRLAQRHNERSETERGIDYISDNVKLINSSIDINGSEVRGTLFSDNIIFNNFCSFKGCVFDQGVHFRGTQFKENISFQNSKFVGNAFLEWGKFDGTVDFGNSIFCNGTHFLEAIFSDDSSFKNAEFHNIVDMRNAKFIGSAKFESTIYGNGVYLEKIQFLNDVDFRKALFSGLAGFYSANFKGDADFRGTEFQSDAAFPYSQFLGKARFSNVKFDGSADFRMSVFSDDALFWDSLFERNAYFTEDIFDKNVDFEDTIFKSNAEFSHVQFSNNRKYSSNFLNSSYGGIANFAFSSFSPTADMRNLHLKSSLNMTQVVFDRIEMKWNEMHKSMICDDYVYISLINNFKNLGQFEDADNCNYQYGLYRLSHDDLGWSKLSDFISWILCGFGVRPFFVISWSVLMILMFGSIYYFFGALRRDNESKNEAQKICTFCETIYFSTAVFLVSLPPQGLHPTDRWRYVVMLEDILGWVLMTLFVVILGRVLIR